MRADIIGWVALAVLIWAAACFVIVWATHRWVNWVHDRESGE